MSDSLAPILLFALVVVLAAFALAALFAWLTHDKNKQPPTPPKKPGLPSALRDEDEGSGERPPTLPMRRVP